MSESASALFSIADVGEFRFARFYIVCEEVPLGTPESPPIVCGLSDTLRETVAKVVAENPQSVEDYHNGKEKAIGFLVGQTMKAMKGKANPALVNQILKELL